MTDRVSRITHDLDMHSVESVTRVLDQVKVMGDLSMEEKIDLAKVLSEVFFHAHHNQSTQIPRLALSIENRIIKFGPEMIPYLFHEMLEADSESSAYFGHALAKNGDLALEYVLSKYTDYQHQDHELINIIQTISYFHISEVVKAFPLLLETAKSNNHQITSVALYAIGKLVQKLPHEAVSQELNDLLFGSVYGFLSNAQALVRKSAARALGKMLRKGILSKENQKKLYTTFRAIAGKDEQHNWDRAFIVRREVEDFLPHFSQPSNSTQRYTQHFRIKTKRLLCANTFHFTIEAPLIAKKIEAGQFIIIRPHILSERIPLSVCEWNRQEGSLSIIVSAVGKTTIEINRMEPGDIFQDVVGPLGERSFLPSVKGTCIVIGGGYGTGAIIPTAKNIKALGNKVIGIVGARNQENVIMLSELNQVCDEVLVTTNDGSKGMKGFVTDALQKVLERENIVFVLAVGPVPMMKAVSEMTRSKNINTYVSLNAVMVDGTGMCGACRVTVGGETKFACFHGPDFDGHKVDFENLMMRQKMFVKQEKFACDKMKI